MTEEQGPQNSIQFLVMMIKAFITGIPQMIKSMIIAAVISGLVTLGLHFYLILYPNDGYNSSGNPVLDSILVLANVNPTPPNVLLFWFLGNYLFWWVIGTFKEHGIVGGFKQFATTPVFVAKSLRESAVGAFPMIMAGLGLALILRLWILGTMTTLQMLLMSIGVLVSQDDSIALIGLQLFFNDVKGLVNRGKEYNPPTLAMPTTLILGTVIGFAYLVYFPYNAQMVQILAGLMILGLIGMFVQGRKKGKADRIAMILMLLCVFTLAITPVNADDGGAAETGGAGNVIRNASLRNFMIKQGINPALAGIAASLVAQGKMTKGIFEQLKKGKIDPRKTKTIQEMQTLQEVRSKLLDNLQHMDHEIWFGKAQQLWKEKGSPGDLRKHIDGMIDDIIHGREVDINKYGQIHNIYTGHVTGRYITEDQIPTDAQLNREIFENTVSWTAREIATGQDIDGNVSWVAVGTRIAVGVGTGGQSEWIWAPAEGTYRVYDNMMAGDSAGWAITKAVAWAATEELVIGKGIQWGLGKVAPIAGKALKKAGSYVDETFPGASKMVKDAFSEGGVMRRDITDLWPNKSKPGLPRGSQHMSASEIAENMNRVADSGQKVPGLDDLKIGQRGADGKIDVDFGNMKSYDGDLPMVPRDVRGFEEAAEMSDTIVVVRKGNDAGLDVIQTKQAHPKSMDIKAKSIDETDRLLGFDDSLAIDSRGTNEGLVGCKKPKLPDDFNTRSPAERTEIMDRYWQRMDEFEKLGPELQQMKKQGKIEWDPETGIIRNAKDGRPYAGDNDTFIYLDPDTAQPLNPIRNNTVNRTLQQNGTTLHNEHAGWNYDGYKNTNPGKYDQYKGIDEKILTKHKDGGLLAYNPRTKQWYEVAYDGPTTRNYDTWIGIGDN